MKNLLTKVITSALALTLVAASAVVATAPVKEVPTEEAKAPQIVETVEAKEEAKAETGIIAAIEAKAKEEAIARIEEAEAPALEIAKADPIAKMEAPKAAAEEVAAPEIIVAPAEEIAAIEAEPEMVWDISATEEDNVAMAFYAAPAAEEKAILEYNGGSVAYITGSGYMADSVYKNFATTAKFLEVVEAMFEDYYEVDVELVYDDTIDDIVALDTNLRYYNAETGEELYVTEDMRENLNPADFMEFSPTTIVVSEGVKNISDFAFLLCYNLKTVVLPQSIETIGEFAFEFCDALESIVIPEGAEIDTGAFAYCYELKFVRIADESVYSGVAVAADLDNFDFDNPPEGYLTAAEVETLVRGY